MVCPYFYPEGGGLENYVYNISKGLVKKGIKVTVLCSTKEGADKTETIDGIKVIRQKPDFILSNTPLTFRLFSTLSKLVKEEHFDIINAHTPVPYYADVACVVASKQNVPFFLTYHSSQLKKDKPVYDFFISVYQNLFERRMFDQAKRIIPVSDYPLRTFLKDYAKKCTIISPAVDPEKFKPGKSSPGKSILFVGQISTFHRWKGLDHLIEAMKLLPKDIKLSVIGSGDLLDYYKKKAKEDSLNIEFKGRISNEKLPEEYQKTRAVIVPSTSNMEGLPTVILEAMACGKPVIGTKVGGISYAIKDGETGILVPQRDSRALNEAIIKILINEKLAVEMGRNGCKLVRKKFIWEKCIGTFLKLIRA